jgi:hypothetical protein
MYVMWVKTDRYSFYPTVFISQEILILVLFFDPFVSGKKHSNIIRLLYSRQSLVKRKIEELRFFFSFVFESMRYLCDKGKNSEYRELFV